jgi:hypothetical protein
MADKVIHEVRFIETDDGFRIEVKGDKERMREMGFGPGFGPGMGFGWMHRRHWRRGRGWHGFGPGHFGPWGPWWDDELESDETPSEKA